MSNRRVVGQLKGAEYQINIEWEIADFLSLSANVDDRCHSPTYFFCDSSWYLRVYSNGEKQHSSEGYIGVYVMRGDSGPPVSATYRLSFEKRGGRRVLLDEHKQTFHEKDYGWGVVRAIPRSELIVQKWEFLPSGVLTVICSLKCDVGADPTTVKDSAQSVHSSSQTDSAFGTEKLSLDFNELLLSGEDSDMTVMVKGVEFRLHRGIMGARTPVFGAMFRHEMKEKATGIVCIDDCEAEVFRAFIQHVYSGSVNELSTDTVFGLFALADKYQVDELKSTCIEFIQSTLSADTFCDVVSLALMYDRGELLQQATDYFAKKMVDVLQNVKWMTFLTKHPIQANELMLKAAKKIMRNKDLLLFSCSVKRTKKADVGNT